MSTLFQISLNESKRQLNVSPPIQVKKLDNFVSSEVINYISEFVDLDSPFLKILDTTNRFNVELIEKDKVNSIINLGKINKIRFINKFFETVNSKLYDNGTFIGCVETYEERFRKIFSKHLKLIAWFIYSLDFVVRRVFPKFRLTKKIYYFLTRDANRAVSRVEALGRLVSCGFKIIDYKEINNLLYFVVKKVHEPFYPANPSYDFILKLRRIGKGGKTIYVYKMRTMHPYAEYLQEHVYNTNSLKEGGKFNNDFRITSWGRLFRKLWLDELPMILNLLKGDLKLVGVRPLSQHYLSLYSQEIKNLRLKTKPGLVPPYYADMPTTLDEIMRSEERYLHRYSDHPWLTDWQYFWKAFYNIVLKKARSS